MLALVNTAGAELAIFLVGCNLAIVYSFWPEVWLTVKLLAVSGLLLFAAITMFLGDGGALITYIGIAATCLDAGAVFGVWHSLHGARSDGGVLIAYRRR